VHESTVIAENVTVKPPVAVAVAQWADDPASETVTRIRSCDANPAPLTVNGEASATAR